jgi:glyoxylase-like metal-dependent hydrolase (beta-lactamase superfamily II)
MSDEVFPDVHRIEIPLPRNPLKAINSYVVRGGDRFLVVDTGMNRPECLDVMRQSLKGLCVDLGRTDIFITHGHSDHIGLVAALETAGSHVFVNPIEATHVLDPDLWNGLAAAAHTHGFPEPETAIDTHPGRMYLFTGRPHFTRLQEGDTIAIGKYTFRCVATPGHTPGHLCLYEADAKILFSGDHILDTITPNISGWGCDGDPLGEYLESLDKIAAYDIRLILPGHRNVIWDHHRRIAELKEHHRHRIGEVMGILESEGQTAYQTASQMTWDIDCSRWEDFPVPQKWFATGEALAHLLYLERAGKVKRGWRDRRAYFSR